MILSLGRPHSFDPKETGSGRPVESILLTTSPSFPRGPFLSFVSFYGPKGRGSSRGDSFPVAMLVV